MHCKQFILFSICKKKKKKICVCAGGGAGGGGGGRGWVERERRELLPIYGIVRMCVLNCTLFLIRSDILLAPLFFQQKAYD